MDAPSLKPAYRDWFRSELERLRITQAEAAWRLRVHPSTVSHWCSRASALPSYEQLVRVAEEFRNLPPALLEPLASQDGSTEPWLD